MSKVKKEPGYAGLILIYVLILILRMLHIASLDKLFNKKYRFYFLYVPVGFILYYTFFFPFMHVQVVGNEGLDLLRTFIPTFSSIYILWFTISALSTIYFMVEPKLTRYAENMFKECELYINKKTTARKIVIRLRNLVDGYYIPFGIASITIGIGGRKNATKTDFMVISEQMIMNIIHSGRNRRKMLMRNRIEAVILI